MAKQNFWQKAFDTNGFEITLHGIQHIVQIRTWGDWDAELAKKYRSALSEIIAESHENDQKWGILVDVSDEFSRSEGGQWMIGEQSAIADTRRIRKIAYLGTNAAFQFQRKELFRTPDMPKSAFFESKDDALCWLLTDEMKNI